MPHHFCLSSVVSPETVIAKIYFIKTRSLSTESHHSNFNDLLHSLPKLNFVILDTFFIKPINATICGTSKIVPGTSLHQ